MVRFVDGTLRCPRDSRERCSQELDELNAAYVPFTAPPGDGGSVPDEPGAIPARSAIYSEVDLLPGLVEHFRPSGKEYTLDEHRVERISSWGSAWQDSPNLRPYRSGLQYRYAQYLNTRLTVPERGTLAVRFMATNATHIIGYDNVVLGYCYLATAPTFLAGALGTAKYTIVTPSIYSLGNWYTLIMTWDGSLVRLITIDTDGQDYVDYQGAQSGSPDITATIKIGSTTSPLAGMEMNGGCIRAAALLSRAISPAEADAFKEWSR